MKTLEMEKQLENSRLNEHKVHMVELDASEDLGEDLKIKYDKGLHQFFFHGVKITDGIHNKIFPATLSQNLNQESLNMEFPVIYDFLKKAYTPLKDSLSDLINQIFSSYEQSFLIPRLPSIISQVQNQLYKSEGELNFRSKVDIIYQIFLELKKDKEDFETFDQHCKQLKAELLAGEKVIIPFTPVSVFQILNLNLIEKREQNQTFLKKIKSAHSGLKEILRLQGKKSDTPKKDLEFVDDLIAFDKVNELSLSEVSTNLSDSRIAQIRDCRDILNYGLKKYEKNSTLIIVSKEIANEFKLKSNLNNAALEVVSDNASKKIVAAYKVEIEDYVKIIKALKIAELEIEYKYDPEFHDLYFKNFDRSYINEQDLSFIKSIILIEDTNQLRMDTKHLLSLMSQESLIKVIALNRTQEMVSLKNSEEGERDLDLVSLALFQRRSLIYQGGTENPFWLNNAFRKGMSVKMPVLWNVIIGTQDEESYDDYIKQKTAIDSRFFPRLVFDPESEGAFTDRLNIGDNIQSDLTFPIIQIDVKTNKQVNQQTFQQTTSDFLALDLENIKALEVLPTNYHNEALILIDQYLELSKEERRGKIPFFWVIEEEQKLKRAISPISWIARCREKMEFWKFLWEMSSKKTKLTKEETDKIKAEWETSKLEEIEILKNELLTKFERNRSEDLEKAIKRMLNKLVDGKFELPNTQPLHNAVTLKEEVLEIVPEVAEPEPVEESHTIKSEAWIESDECTSCNDCIDALPGVFKYNEDKLAYVHNPKGGPYAKIVAAAEKCPAACIHPGLPHDSSENNLEKLIKRAEKFN